MMEIINSLFGDTLWIYTSVAGALLGAACLAYIQTTRIGLWGYAQFDKLIDFFRDRYGWTWLAQDPDAWLKANPQLAAKLAEFDERLAKLEKKFR